MEEENFQEKKNKTKISSLENKNLSLLNKKNSFLTFYTVTVEKKKDFFCFDFFQL